MSFDLVTNTKRSIFYYFGACLYLFKDLVFSWSTTVFIMVNYYVKSHANMALLQR